jgi:tRNA-2-methylthio-N6-dimethylallyladenosine synthase
MIGQKVKVLVTGPSKKEPGWFSGKTENNRIVRFVGYEFSTPDPLVQVEITEALTHILYGKRVA